MARDGTALLLLIDDEPAQKRLISAIAARAGWRTLYARDTAAAIPILGTTDGRHLDAVLIDQWNKQYPLTDTIQQIRQRCPNLPILIITPHDDVANAVAAMRAGASDYLTKPIAPDKLICALNASLNTYTKQSRELQPLTEKMPASLAFDEIVGSTPQFLSALAIAAKAANASAPVLIEGEDGSGKEVIAHAIHAASHRSNSPLVTVNCGAIPENLLESVLFGHERGAFTGAFERQIGKCTEAHLGSIFLDEIDTIPPEAQIKLLRLLQDGDFLPLGGQTPVRSDVRIIAACNGKLQQAVDEGRFREDLYYRLNIINVSVPPLRERKSDIPALAHHLLDRFAHQPGMRNLGITSDALSLLMQHDWPGNVRQLQNVLFRAAILCENNSLTPNDFPQISSQISLRKNGTGTNALVNNRGDAHQIILFNDDGNIRSMSEIEADIIRIAISHYRGRMTEVARQLGIGRSTLYRKLAELGLDNNG